MPSAWRSRSISRWRSSTPEARTASSAVAPGGSSSATESSPAGRAYTTSILRLAIERVGPARERIDQGIGDMVEERLQHPSERPGHLVLEREFDRARLAR